MNALEKMTVKDIFRLVEEAPVILKRADDFSQVINNFAHPGSFCARRQQPFLRRNHQNRLARLGQR